MIILSKEEQEQIYKDFITENFKTEIENHKNGNCNCDLTEGETGLCDIGQWLEGCISSEELLRNYDYIIGNITKDGLIEKEYYSQGYIYKNVPNYWAKKGICYISEYQGEAVAKPLIGIDGKQRIDEFGEEEYEEDYYITENSKEGKHFETYNSIQNVAKFALENEFGKSNEKDIRFLANEIFDMVDWQFASSLASELVENYELEVK